MSETKEVLIATSATVAELADAARAHITNEEYVEGFTLLNAAHAKALHGDILLHQDDAISLGTSLALAGHILYNVCIGDDGRDLPGFSGIASEAAGRNKFYEATDVFTSAIKNDPQDPRGYLGLLEMQFELSQDSADTFTQLESLLDERPDKDNVQIRMDMAQLYELRKDGGSAMSSYAKAIEHSVSQRHTRHTAVSTVGNFLLRYDEPEPHEVQLIGSACLRAMIQDPNEHGYRDIYSFIQRYLK